MDFELEDEITAIDINTVEMSINNDQFIYSGEECKPEIESELEENVDYTKEYVDNIEVGTGKVIVTGTLLYEGTREFLFTINPIDISEYNFILDKYSYQYDGNPITPEVTSVENLIKDVDYTVSYSDNIYPGEGIITINGINHYSGSVTITFNIVGKNISTSEVSCGEPNDLGLYNLMLLTVKYEGIILKRNRDYEVSVSDAEDDLYTISTVTISGLVPYYGKIIMTYRTEYHGSDEVEPVYPELIEDLIPGTPIYLNGVDIYPRFGSLVPSISKTGIFYIYDNNIKNNRIRITSSTKALVTPGMITGWVNVSDILYNSDKFKINDKVLVSGKLNTEKDGSGSYINYSNKEMYIVYIVDHDQYPYSYGVANSVNRKPIAWAKEEFLQIC